MQPNTMLTNTCFNSVQWLRHMLQIEFKTTRFCNSSPHFSVFFSKELRTAGSELKVLLCLRINANCYKCMKVKKHLPIRERDRLTAVVKGNWRKKIFLHSEMCRMICLLLSVRTACATLYIGAQCSHDTFFSPMN